MLMLLQKPILMQKIPLDVSKVASTNCSVASIREHRGLKVDLKAPDLLPQQRAKLEFRSVTPRNNSRRKAMSEQKPEQHRIITIYGYRGGWVDDDGEENMSSVMRGYASLNGAINSLLKVNPEMVLHSVSHATTMFPPDRSGYLTIMQSATVVYSGRIRTGFESVRTDGKLIDDDPGYGTIMHIGL
jgi:hypothetical protein